MNTLESIDTLSTRQAAAKLGTSPLAVRRLVARRLIPAAVDDDDDTRIHIDPGDLARYVEAGMPDFPGPRFDARGRWFFEPDSFRAAELFCWRCILAVDSQLPSDDELLARFGTAADATVAMETTGGVEELLAAAVPAEFRGAGRYPDWRTLYLAEKIRRAARAILRRPEERIAGLSALERLYASPEAYERIARAAAAAVRADRIAFCRELAIGGRRAVLTFALRHRDIAPPATFGQAAALAF
jgi:hypothetical protein